MSRHKSSIVIALAVAAALGLSACANNPNRRAEIGGGIGAVAGGLLGSQLGDSSGTNAAIGAALGALAGGGIGHYMDKQQQELNKKLAAQRARNELNIQRLNQDTLKIGVASDASFAVNSATLNPNAQNTFNSIASVLKNYKKTAIHVVGFTDSTGSKQHNLKLSKERADAVAQFLESRGVNSQRVLTWARGESEPVASNATAAGRAKNRRVAIVIKPIVKGNEKAAFSAPPDLGNPKYENTGNGNG
ncbi:OmpA family protein [Salinisphaera sp. LB1]|uniref:OmpA family protein n=1 Tax=Salinisphaera sp. LB1 TaxID=2183911 RepID=UPI000D7D2772|nr:OmpA family protein [Salinisphaera sp. LB1]AWN17667.1 Outer membrane protein A precursor [Salinisphaera sp. LB1]